MDAANAVRAIAPAFSVALPQFSASSRRLAACVSVLDPNDEEFIGLAATHVADYTDTVAPLVSSAFSAIARDLPRTRQWASHSKALRGKPAEGAVWHHLVLAMGSVTELGEAVTTALCIDPKIYEPHRRAHRDNLVLFEASAQAVDPPGGAAVASAILWCARRGIDVSKRYGVFVAMSGALQGTPDAIQLPRTE